MKFVLSALLLLTCGAVATKAQSCLTQDDVRQMLARIESPSQTTPDQKLREELLKIAIKQRELLMDVVDKDQAKESDRKKLQKLYADHSEKLCQIHKTRGWHTDAIVGPEGVFATFYILKNAGTFELQRDLLPVILAVVKKDPSQKPEFAALMDRLRVSAGMKQVFGTEAVTRNGFLVLYP